MFSIFVDEDFLLLGLNSGRLGKKTWLQTTAGKQRNHFNLKALKTIKINSLNDLCLSTPAFQWIVFAFIGFSLFNAANKADLHFYLKPKTIIRQTWFWPWEESPQTSTLLPMPDVQAKVYSFHCFCINTKEMCCTGSLTILLERELGLWDPKPVSSRSLKRTGLHSLQQWGKPWCRGRCDLSWWS